MLARLVLGSCMRSFAYEQPGACWSSLDLARRPAYQSLDVSGSVWQYPLSAKAHMLGSPHPLDSPA